MTRTKTGTSRPGRDVFGAKSPRTLATNLISRHLSWRLDFDVNGCYVI